MPCLDLNVHSTLCTDDPDTLQAPVPLLSSMFMSQAGASNDFTGLLSICWTWLQYIRDYYSTQAQITP